MNSETDKSSKPKLIIQRYSKPYLFEQFNLTRIKIKKKKSFTEVYHSDDEYSSNNYLKRKLNQLDQLRNSRHSRSVETNIVKSDYEMKDDKLMNQNKSNCLISSRIVGKKFDLISNSSRVSSRDGFIKTELTDSKIMKDVFGDLKTEKIDKNFETINDASIDEQNSTNSQTNSLANSMNNGLELNSSRSSSLPSPRCYTLPMRRFLFQKISKESRPRIRSKNRNEQNVSKKTKSIKETDKLNELKIKLRQQQSLLSLLSGDDSDNQIRTNEKIETKNEINRELDEVENYYLNDVSKNENFYDCSNDKDDKDAKDKNDNKDEINDEIIEFIETLDKETINHKKTMNLDEFDDEDCLMNSLIQNEYGYQSIWTFEDDSPNYSIEKQTNLGYIDRNLRHSRTKKHRNQNERSTDHSKDENELRSRQEFRSMDQEFQITERFSVEDLSNENAKDYLQQDHQNVHEQNENLIEVRRDESIDDKMYQNEIYQNETLRYELELNDLNQNESIEREYEHHNQKLDQNSCQKNCCQTISQHQNNTSNVHHMNNFTNFHQINHLDLHQNISSNRHSTMHPDNSNCDHRQINYRHHQFNQNENHPEIEFFATVNNQNGINQLINLPSTIYEQQSKHRNHSHHHHHSSNRKLQHQMNSDRFRTTSHRMKMSMNKNQLYSNEIRPSIDSLTLHDCLSNNCNVTKSMNNNFLIRPRTSNSSRSNSRNENFVPLDRCISNRCASNYMLKWNNSIKQLDYEPTIQSPIDYQSNESHLYQNSFHYRNNYSHPNYSNFNSNYSSRSNDYEQYDHHYKKSNNFYKQNCCSNHCESTFYDSPFSFVGFDDR